MDMDTYSEIMEAGRPETAKAPMDMDTCSEIMEVGKPETPKALTGFGRRLREARKNCGYTTGGLASIIGVNQTTISHWELEKTKPNDQRIMELCNALNTSRGYLLRGEDNTLHAEKVVVTLDSGIKEIQKEVKPVGKMEEDLRALTYQVPKKYNKKDKTILEDLNIIVNHLPDLNLSTDEKKSLYLTVSELRNEYESKVLFGE